MTTTREQRLRELVRKWRNPKWEPSNENEDGWLEGVSYCADELAAILTDPVEVSEEMVEQVWDQLPTNVDITRRDVRLVLTAALNLKELGQ